jgi:putative transposase
MLMGIKMRAYPTEDQKSILSKWMGCARVIWNAKCEEWTYLSTYARKYMPVGTYADIDASYSQYKDNEITPYLSGVPSQVLRNAANLWRDTMRDWMNPKHPQKSPARRKKKQSEASVYLTNELYEFAEKADGTVDLIIGTKKFPVGKLKFIAHRGFKIPKSIRIKKKAGLWFLSFCYDDALLEDELLSDKEALKIFKEMPEEELQKRVIGVDRGIAIACHTDSQAFDLSPEAKAKRKKKERYLKSQQKRIARQKKGSKRREKTKGKISRTHGRIANVRDNFCHQTSNSLTKVPGNVIVMEDLKTSNMTRRSKPKQNEATGKWEKNHAAQKSGLNRSILSVGWYKLEQYTRYKARRRGSLLVKINPQFSSQECADCDHIQPENRVNQAEFVCQRCGHRDNADHNAALVLKKRAINLLKHSGTELSAKGVLSLVDTGRGVQSKTSKPKAKKQERRSVKNDGGSRVQIPEARAL